MAKKKQKDGELQRIVILTLLPLVLVAFYIIRLFYLQILTPDYKQKSEKNAFYYRPIYPERGNLYDRNGELLVFNEAAYDIYFIPREVKKLDTLLFCQLLGVSKEELDVRFKRTKNRRFNSGYSRYTPQRLLSQISLSHIARFQEHISKFPGFFVYPRSIRRYNTSFGAHILGYVAECNQREIKLDSTLSLGDYVGKSGVERFYQKHLAGEKGYQVMLRDARGRLKSHYKNGQKDKASQNGHTIYLSIDSKLQELGERLMKGKRGAIVVLDPNTGEVLSMVSSPTFSPELFSGKNLGKNHLKLMKERGKPLFNRAIQGSYPPGSTFKTTQAALLLQEGVITPYTQYTCAYGYPRLHSHPACHGHTSPLSVKYALTTSCNAFFAWGWYYMLDDRNRYSSIQEAFTKWKDYMVSMGCGYVTGLDLPGEKRGFIPNSHYYDKWYRGRWNSSTIISNAIGQGEILATPLQMANYTAIIANRGFYYIPHIIHKIEGLSLERKYTNPKKTTIEERHWEVVAQGMRGAVLNGTCRAANLTAEGISVCGKTGTAENSKGKDHSVFVGFAPYKHPKVVVAVYVENGGFGADFGVPIGRVMIESYLRSGVLSETSQKIVEKMAKKSIYYSNE